MPDTYWTAGTDPNDIVNTNSGNVGIDTTTPDGKLVVSNDGANGLEVFPDANAGTVTILQSFDRTGSEYTPMTASSLQFRVNTGTLAGGVSEKVRVTEDGKVGINTADPANEFHTIGNGRFSKVDANASMAVAYDLSVPGNLPADIPVGAINFQANLSGTPTLNRSGARIKAASA